MKLSYYLLYKIGKIKLIDPKKFEIYWHSINKRKCYPRLLHSIQTEGYNPFSKQSFIQGFWKMGKFIVVSGKHKAQAIKELKYPFVYCIIINKKESYKRITFSKNQDIIGYYAMRILEELKFKLKGYEVTQQDDKFIVSIVKKNMKKLLEDNNANKN